MPSLLAKRIQTTLYQRFVGRKRECELFFEALNAPELPFAVLHLFGFGGVGKTTLLREFMRLCDTVHIQVIYLDAHQIQPFPATFLNALHSAMKLDLSESPLSILTATSERQVLIIDSYEQLTALDDWLREEFLPQLTENTLIVLAGRYSPSPSWRSAPGWQSLLSVLPLENLSLLESQLYLIKREVPASQHQPILDFTHGHPLALSLMADLSAQGQAIKVEPTLIKTLLEKFLEKVPSPSYRMALEVCAIVRFTTEALLAEILGKENTNHELFEWLRQLSFIESGTLGVFPNNLAREVLIADLRWRHPDGYRELFERVRTYYLNCLAQTQGQKQQKILLDYLFLEQDNLAIRSRFTWHNHEQLLIDTVRENEKEIVIQMIADHEGEKSAQIAAYWLKKQPQGVFVWRDEQERLAGFLMIISLQQASTEELANDPITQTAWNYLQNHAPLSASETAIMVRFWVPRDTYPDISVVQSQMFLNLIQYHLKTPELAFTFVNCAEPEFWQTLLSYVHFTRLREVDFQVKEECSGIYGRDWRVSTQVQPQKSHLSAIKAQVVLDETEFLKAVQDALRYYDRPDVLRKSSLLRSRLIQERVGTKADNREQVLALQKLLSEAVDTFKLSPREDKFYYVLHRTYLSPAPTQEQAADLLNLPFSTYRRYLKTGVTRVSERLWQQENEVFFIRQNDDRSYREGVLNQHLRF